VAALATEFPETVVLAGSFSKTYAMTGWRIGYTGVTPALAPLIKAMSTIQGQSTSNPSHIAQVATLAALTGPQDCVEEMRRAFDERRQVMARMLRAIPDVRLVEPAGAFYCFPDLSAYLGRTTPGGRRLDDDVALTDWLVDEGGVAIVPGSGFGAPGFVRLAYATSMANIEKGVGRLHTALASLR
jgi:aspartate aminotransferase